MASPSPYYNPGGPPAQYGGSSPSYTPPSYNAPSPMAGWGAPSTSSASAQPDTSPFGNFFDDPTSQPINTAWNQRMTQLNQAAPNYGDITSTLGSYLQPDPRFNAGLAALAQSAGGSAAQAKVLDNPYTAQFATATTNRMKELNQDPFSSSDEAALKARFFDSLALSRDDAYKQNAQQMASRGLAPSSGVAQALGAETSAGYQKARAGQQQALLQYVTDERNRRRDAAVGMSGNLQQAGLADTSEKQGALTSNASLANQWQATRASILGNVLQAIQGQQGLGLNAATTMASLRRQQYLDDNQRGADLLQTSALPNALTQARMQALQQTLAGGPTSQSLFGQYSQMNAQQIAQAQANAQRNAAIWGAAGQIGAGVANNINWGQVFS
jgi:hypothetical protein